jgi:hypothetical protein
MRGIAAAGGGTRKKIGQEKRKNSTNQIEENILLFVFPLLGCGTVYGVRVRPSFHRL